MDKSAILKRLFDKKTKDYTYATIFFFIFSFFVLFIIKPNINSVYEANAKIVELKKTNAMYENQIDKIIEIQSILETNRDDLVFLNEAITQKPKVNKVLSDIYSSSINNKLDSDNIDVTEVNLKDRGSFEKIKSFSVNLNSKGRFEDVLAFVRTIYSQRRLKLTQDLAIGRGAEVSSKSSELKISLQIEGYYL